MPDKNGQVRFGGAMDGEVTKFRMCGKSEKILVGEA